MIKHNRLMQEAYEREERERHVVSSDPFRLSYHLMPPVGLLNDPNGFIYFQGAYHVFYQWNPFETGHGAKFWGHYRSSDLISWKEEPIALAPDEWYDKNGCYSGSAVEHDGKLYIFYTGNVKDEDGKRSSYQCLAVSEDGVTFEKKGPVIHVPAGYTAHFRDPKVWREHGVWHMVLGAQNSDLQGEAVLFRSANLTDWEFVGPIAGSGISGLGDFGYMWECPDMFKLGDKDVLIVSPQGLEPDGTLYQNLFQSGYFIGKWDSKSHKLCHGSFTELDRGFDFYAPQTTLDANGKRLMFAWMGITDAQEQDQPTVKNEWIHALTMPRELILAGGRIYQKPVEELKALRANPVEYREVSLKGDGPSKFEGIGGITAELIFSFPKGVRGTFELIIRENVRLQYDPNTQTFTLERKTFKGDGEETRQCTLEELETIHVFLDTSSIEVFLNGGTEVFTSRFFPDPDVTSIVMQSEKQEECTIQKWDLQPFALERGTDA